MDIDILEEAPSASLASTSSNPGPSAGKTKIVPVDDAHPFDLDAYALNYTGRTVVDRLTHIIRVCPTLAPQALQLATQHIHQLRDPALFQAALAAYDQLPSELELPPGLEIASLDPAWVDQVTQKNNAERTKLEVELKTYANSMIKESIRMAHRDLGDFYKSVGEFNTAIKHYTKSREYCTTSHHIVEMSLSVLEVLIEQKNYAHIPTYVFKADAALEAASASAAPAAGTPAATASAVPKKSADREKVQSKLDFASALSYMGQGNFEKAAQTFARLGPPAQLGDWVGKLVAPGDIALYGALSALASLPRSAIRSQVLDNLSFSMYIEQEPHVRELLEAYMGSNFKSVLELLERFSSRHYIDIHLAPQVHDLTHLITNSAVVLYFQPFATVRLERMGAAFGWGVEELERHVVALIQSGAIQARVDSQNKILHAKKADQRAELFARAMAAGKEMERTNRKLLLRMRLQQADLVVKASKAQQQAAAMQD